MKVLYLDESGDHNLIKIERDYPVFVLGGVILERAYASTTLEDELRYFKLGLFGRDDLILHTADIARNTNGFERLQETGFRQRFYDELNGFMSDLEYQVVACVIQKDRHKAKLARMPRINPYQACLDLLASPQV